MAYLNKTPDSVLSFERDAPAGAALTQRRSSHVAQVLKHIRSAKVRKAGRDITDLTEEELIADLRAHKHSA